MAQIVTIKSAGGTKKEVFPMARKVNIVKTEETGINIKRSSDCTYCPDSFFLGVDELINK